MRIDLVGVDFVGIDLVAPNPFDRQNSASHSEWFFSLLPVISGVVLGPFCRYLQKLVLLFPRTISKWNNLYLSKYHLFILLNVALIHIVNITIVTIQTLTYFPLSNYVFFLESC